MIAILDVYPFIRCILLFPLLSRCLDYVARVNLINVVNSLFSLAVSLFNISEASSVMEACSSYIFFVSHLTIITIHHRLSRFIDCVAIVYFEKYIKSGFLMYVVCASRLPTNSCFFFFIVVGVFCFHVISNVVLVWRKIEVGIESEIVLKTRRLHGLLC